MIAKIAVSAAVYSIDKPYSYWIPDGITVAPGQRVTVPFGAGNRTSEGLVLSVEDGTREGLKSIAGVLDPEPVLDGEMLRTAAFVRERYFCTLYDAARAALPAGLWFQVRERYEIRTEADWETLLRSQPLPLKIMEFLRDLGGGCEEATLFQTFGKGEDVEEALGLLKKKKLIKADTNRKRKINDRTEQVASLAASTAEAREYAARVGKKAPMQRAVLDLLCDLGTVSVKELCYFTGASAATVKRLERLGYVALCARPTLRCRDIRPAEINGPLILTKDQQEAFDTYSKRMESDQPGVGLLYGVTGSGKTSVYLKLIVRCLTQGRSALLMVPEIGLTPQLLSLLAAYFGPKVAVLHSSLAVGERYDQWKRIRSGEATVVVGTRSAVFAPCRNLGLIILDEEQEHSYKSENSPRYCAREVAMFRGSRLRALVLLGSATPSVESMYRARSGIYTLCTLPGRFNGRELPGVSIVDMKQELKAGNALTLSRPLVDGIRENLRQGHQTILLLNRRGSSRMLICVDCGHVPQCPRCSVHLTYHSVNHRLMCHYCGFSQPVTERCPECGGHLKSVGAGTQKVEQELNELFPGMPVERMDADTVSASNTHEAILERFKREKIPVLIGTQMVAKGLDLPNVTLVGVLDGDLSLYVGSFRAGETTVSKLTQAVGRAGRGEHPGRAIIQTMTPENQVIRLAARQDYGQFYDMEVSLRQARHCPPFGDHITLSFTGPEESRVLYCAAQFRQALATGLTQLGLQAQVLGPAPAPIVKINYNLRYRLTIEGKADKPMRTLVSQLLRQFARDRAHRGVSAYADLNAYD